MGQTDHREKRETWEPKERLACQVCLDAKARQDLQDRRGKLEGQESRVQRAIKGCLELLENRRRRDRKGILESRDPGVRVERRATRDAMACLLCLERREIEGRAALLVKTGPLDRLVCLA